MPSNDPLLQPTPPAPKPVPGTVPPAPTTPVKLCLLIVFNHRFEANLPKLDWLYRDRFEHIRYLIPFYRGSRPDVFPVYYASYQFQGFYMEAWRRLRDEGFTHFLVCADDMVLNPQFTDKNFLETLGIGTDRGYIKDLRSLAEFAVEWSAMASGLVAVAGKNGVNWEKELPDPAEAAANLEAKGFPLGRLGWHNLHKGIRAKGAFQSLFYLILRVMKRRREPGTDLLGLPYPLLGGVSDIMVIPAAYMDKFCFYCSVFAAMGVFVEIGAPTALALACPQLTREQETGWVGRDYWSLDGPDQLDAFCRLYDYRLENLLDRFEERTICYHPIKLSQWSYPGTSA